MKDIKSNTSDLRDKKDPTQANILGDNKSLPNSLKSGFKWTKESLILEDSEEVGGFNIMTEDDSYNLAQYIEETEPDMYIAEVKEQYGEDVAHALIEIRADAYGDNLENLAYNAENDELWDQSLHYSEKQPIEIILFNKLKEQTFTENPLNITIYANDIETEFRRKMKNSRTRLRDDFLIGALYGDVWEFFYDDYYYDNSLYLSDIEHLFNEDIYKDLETIGLNKDNIDNYEEILGEDNAKKFVNAFRVAVGDSSRVGAESHAIDWFMESINEAIPGVGLEREWSADSQFFVQVTEEFFDYLFNDLADDTYVSMSFIELMVENYTNGEGVRPIIVSLVVEAMLRLEEPYGGFYGTDDEVFRQSFIDRLYEEGLLHN